MIFRFRRIKLIDKIVDQIRRRRKSARHVAIERGSFHNATRDEWLTTRTDTETVEKPENKSFELDQEKYLRKDARHGDERRKSTPSFTKQQRFLVENLERIENLFRREGD